MSDTHSDSHTHREVYVESGDSHVNRVAVGVRVLFNSESESDFEFDGF